MGPWCLVISWGKSHEAVDSNHRLKLQKDGHSIPQFMIKNDLYFIVTIYTIKLSSMFIIFFMNDLHSTGTEETLRWGTVAGAWNCLSHLPSTNVAMYCTSASRLRLHGVHMSSTPYLTVGVSVLQWTSYRIAILHLNVSFLDVCLSVHRCICVEKKNQLDVTVSFIAFMIGSTCFGHFYAHYQEL